MGAYVQANTNGRLHPADEPSNTPLNRGFLYGDAIYEVWRTYDGVLFAWNEHWQRLLRSADALYFDLPFSSEQILAEIKRTVAAYRAQAVEASEIYVRLQITRGAGSLGLDTALADQPFFVLLVQENKLFTPEKFRAGLRLSVARDLRRNSPEALNPAWKTGNYLNNILCLREACARGADEVLICNLRGEITEAAVSNIGFVKAGVVITPPFEAGILAGITRKILLDHVAPTAGIPVVERTVMPGELAAMDECFLLSSTKDITPVASIDACSFKMNERSVTLKLKQAFGDYARSYAAAHPGLLVINPS